MLTVAVGNLELVSELQNPNDVFVLNALEACEIIRIQLENALNNSDRREASLFGLVEATRQAVTLMSGTMPEEINLKSPRTSSEFVVYAQRSAYEMALLNLVKNAAEAIGDSPGTIDISIRTTHYEQPFEAISGIVPAGDAALVEVHDDGGGMDAVTLFNAMKPGFTTNTGYGLGLPSCLDFVQSNDAGLQIDSHRGHGTIVTLIFPVLI